MNKLVALLRSFKDDAPIVGFLPYAYYRLGPVVGLKQSRLVKIDNQSIWVRPGTPDLRVAFNSLRGELDILSDLFPKSHNGLIIDAGGYIGTSAIKLARMYPSALVVTVEASAQNFKILQKNVAGISNITPVHAALHYAGGRVLSLVDRGTGTWGFSIAVSADDARPAIEEVETVSLDQIQCMFPDRRVSILKLDIEGGEYSILTHHSSLLESIDAVIVELHERIVPGCDEAFRVYSHNRWLIRAGGEKLLSLRRDS